LLDVLWLLGGMVAIVAGVYFLLGLFVDFAVDRMPPDFEQELAGKLEMPFQEALDDKRLQSVGKLLASMETGAKFRYAHRLSIADHGDPNAFALPGGRIVVTRGLLDSVQSENELAMVLGHELGHFAHRDHLRALGRNVVLGILAALIFGSDSDATGLATGTLAVTESRFSRRQEIAADLYGLDLLQKRYGHVGGATDFFARMSKEETRWQYWLATHPASADRVSRVRSEAYRRGYTFKPVEPLHRD
jgi:predicted Zn-dependent protease